MSEADEILTAGGDAEMKSDVFDGFCRMLLELLKNGLTDKAIEQLEIMIAKNQ